MSQQVQGVSLNPETFVQGGLFDDIDLVVEKAEFILTNYGGIIKDKVPALRLSLKDPDTGEAFEQDYSCGSSKQWMPDKSGRFLVAQGAATSIATSSNLAVFLSSLIDNGFPGSKLDSGDIGALEGLKAHFIRKNQPKRAGLDGDKEPKEGDRPKQVLIVNEIHSFPWDTDKGTKKTKGNKAKEPKKDAAAETGDPNDTVIEFIMGLVTEAGGKFSRSDIPKESYKAFKDMDDQKALMFKAYDEEFLKAGPWNYEDGVISL